MPTLIRFWLMVRSMEWWEEYLAIAGAAWLPLATVVAWTAPGLPLKIVGTIGALLSGVAFLAGFRVFSWSLGFASLAGLYLLTAISRFLLSTNAYRTATIILYLILAYKQGRLAHRVRRQLLGTEE